MAKFRKMLLFLAVPAVPVFLLIYLLFFNFQATEIPSQGKDQKIATSIPAKLLSASSAGHTAFFRLQIKWQDGKLYGNSSVTFGADSVRRLADCRYYLLDGEGFLIKAISFSPHDFVFQADSNGIIHSLVNKFNTALSIDDYLRIKKLQVALDGKVPGDEP